MRSSPARVMPLLMFAAIGCGQDNQSSETVPVRGKVFYQGQPLSTGTIVFTPDSSHGTHGPVARGDIQRDGSFALKSGDHEGAVPGRHRVTVVAVHMPPPAAGQRFARPHFLIPSHYSVPDQSGLTCEVKAVKDNEFKFNLP